MMTAGWTSEPRWTGKRISSARARSPGVMGLYKDCFIREGSAFRPAAITVATANAMRWLSTAHLAVTFGAI
jgi:hypothetical protein